MSGSDEHQPLTNAAYESAAAYVRHSETSPYNALYERPAIRSLLHDVAGKRILDAGCAGGIHAEWLIDHGATVVGVDVSEAMLQLARARVGDRARFVRADLGVALPQIPELEAESFDIIISSLTLHYIDDWSVPLGEFRRLLRPGGTLILSTHHPYWDRRLVDGSDYFATGLVTDTWVLSGDTPIELRFFRKTLAEILNATSDAGFVIETVVEPKPSADLRARHPDDFTDLMKQPAFLLVRGARGGITTPA